MNEVFRGAFGPKLGSDESKNYAGDDYEIRFKPIITFFDAEKNVALSGSSCKQSASILVLPDPAPFATARIFDGTTYCKFAGPPAIICFKVSGCTNIYVRAASKALKSSRRFALCWSRPDRNVRQVKPRCHILTPKCLPKGPKNVDEYFGMTSLRLAKLIEHQPPSQH